MRKNKVFVNTSWIIGCKLAQSGLALFVSALTARYFGPSDFGLINYAASLVVFVTPLMTLGTDATLVNEIIRNPEQEGVVLGTSITMTLFSSLVCIAGLYTFARVVNPDEPTTALVVFLYSLLLTAQSIEQIQYWFHAKYLSKIVAVISFFAYIAISVYKIVLLIYRKSIFWFAVANSLDYVLIAAGLLAVYKIRKGQKLRFSFRIARSLWNTSKHYIIPGLLGGILAQSDRIMIRHICGDVEVGFYAAALSVATLTNFVFSAIITAFRPAVLEAKQMDEQKYKVHMVRLYGIIIYLALAQSVAVTIIARYAIKIMYGQAYLPAIPVLQVVVWYTVFSYIGGVRAVWILAENKQRYMWIISFSGMLLNIILNLLLIPRFQGMGAAVATLLTQIFTNIILVYLLRPLRGNIVLLLKGLDVRNLFAQFKKEV